ncbi:hypothetical protein I5V28_13930 [Stenotrophomonas maltophilia]|uniref:hypothetical protein n=1 Tax=Stenotrophomonas maltophilia group sp. Smal32 TaxID=3377164 RepID=UPI0018D2DDE2|nr:hypothetical protein [Stenotrophomonas maltophilia]MBH1746914.1 hypothetical protein [Stenotrophomonas maltophilia]
MIGFYRAKVAAGGTMLEYAILATQTTALKWLNLDNTRPARSLPSNGSVDG